MLAWVEAKSIVSLGRTLYIKIVKRLPPIAHLAPDQHQSQSKRVFLKGQIYFCLRYTKELL